MATFYQRNNLSNFFDKNGEPIKGTFSKLLIWKEHGLNKSSSIERFFWVLATNRQWYEKKFPDYNAIETYMNMSYKLGSDWQILLPYMLG